MQSFFDDVKEKLDRGINLVSVKSKEFIEINQLKSIVKQLEKKKQDKINELGEIVYNMLEAGFLEEKEIMDFYKEIKSVEEEIKTKEAKISELQSKAEEALKEKQTAFAYCPCGEHLSEKTKFCAGCGKNVEDIVRKTREESEKLKCLCGEILTGKSKFCPTCGRKVENTPVQKQLEVKCSCGETIMRGKKFCGNCGSTVNEISKPPEIDFIICPQCNSKLPEGSLFCPDCRSKLSKISEKLTCYNCKVELPEGSLFCPDCGTRFK